MTGMTLAKLRAMSDNELVALHDELSTREMVKFMPSDCLDELNRRTLTAESRTMRICTVWIAIMTAVVTAATLANLVVAFLIWKN